MEILYETFSEDRAKLVAEIVRYKYGFPTSWDYESRNSNNIVVTVEIKPDTPFRSVVVNQLQVFADGVVHALQATGK